MPGYSAVDAVIGNPQIQLFGGVVDTTPRMQPGQMLTASDSYWGTGEFIYARASAGIRAFGLCTITPVFDATLNCWRYDAAEIPNTANLGKNVCVALEALSAGQYSWFQISGVVPVNCTASVAADTTFGIAAAGQGGANAAGKQILNARVIAAASTTVVKANAIADSGSLKLQVPSTDGWFVGAYLSGTGIAAGTYITGIDSGGRSVTLSAATTAAVAGSVTATYNNAAIFYNVVHLNRPFAQGAIT